MTCTGTVWPSSVLDAIVSKGQRTIIQELEMLAVLCAFKCWQEKATIHRSLLFTDSESVRGAFLKSWSANTDSDRLLNSIFEMSHCSVCPSGLKESQARVFQPTYCQQKLSQIFGNATKVEGNVEQVS